MALHLKSTKSFKILIAFSALLISGMAATFSVTGIATLFSGYFLAVAFMMGALEFAKIVVASFLARYWTAVSRVLRGYFIASLVILILITSGGIFGYLSDAYQQTKGDYSIVEKQTSILESKKNMFSERKERLQADRQLELKAKNSNQTRADSLSSRGQNITRTRGDIKQNDVRIVAIEKQIGAAEDSIGSYDLKIVELESQNIKGELGPLKYIAGIFNTDMDTVVKYFIFLLIFVFDPLAVLLFVSLNMIIRKEHGMYKEDEDVTQQEPFAGIENASVDVKQEITPSIDEVKKNLNNELLDDWFTGLDDIQHDDVIISDIPIKTDESEKVVSELIHDFETQSELPDKENEHEFYHGEESKEESKEEPQEEPQKQIKKETEQMAPIVKKSANYHPN